SGEIAEAQALVDVGGPQGCDGRTKLAMDVLGSPQELALVRTLGRRLQHDLTDAQLVEQRKIRTHETDEILAPGGQLLGDIAGVPVAAARDDVGPEVRAQIDTGAPGSALRRLERHGGRCGPRLAHARTYLAELVHERRCGVCRAPRAPFAPPF